MDTFRRYKSEIVSQNCPIDNTDLKTVVGPRAQFQDARLIVEGEISDVHRAGAAEFGRRRPEHFALEIDHGFAVHVASCVVVRTKK